MTSYSDPQAALMLLPFEVETKQPASEPPHSLPLATAQREGGWGQSRTPGRGDGVTGSEWSPLETPLRPGALPRRLVWAPKSRSGGRSQTSIPGGSEWKGRGEDAPLDLSGCCSRAFSAAGDGDLLFLLLLLLSERKQTAVLRQIRVLASRSSALLNISCRVPVLTKACSTSGFALQRSAGKKQTNPSWSQT